MPKHVAEAIVMMPDAKAASNAVCDRSREYCRSVKSSSTVTLLDFADGRAILKSSDEGLHLRVEADDLVTFYGIRTLLQGVLFSTTSIPDDAIEWHSTSGLPLGAVRTRSGNGRSCPGGK